MSVASRASDKLGGGGGQVPQGKKVQSVMSSPDIVISLIALSEIW